VSILYCAIPHFAVALARRDHPELAGCPLIVLDPEDRVFDVSPEGAQQGVTLGLTARIAQIRCPEARLYSGDLERCRQELEGFLEVLEQGIHEPGFTFIGCQTKRRQADGQAPQASQDENEMRPQYVLRTSSVVSTRENAIINMDKAFPTDIVAKYAEIIGSCFTISYGSSLAYHFDRIFQALHPLNPAEDSDL